MTEEEENAAISADMAERLVVGEWLKNGNDWHLRACQATNAASNQFHAISHFTERMAGSTEWDDCPPENLPYGQMPAPEHFSSVMAAYAASGEGHIKVAEMCLKLHDRQGE